MILIQFLLQNYTEFATGKKGISNERKINVLSRCGCS